MLDTIQAVNHPIHRFEQLWIERSATTLSLVRIAVQVLYRTERSSFSAPVAITHPADILSLPPMEYVLPPVPPPRIWLIRKRFSLPRRR